MDIKDKRSLGEGKEVQLRHLNQLKLNLKRLLALSSITFVWNSEETNESKVKRKVTVNVQN